jgi:hypothetical protein
MKEKRLKVKEEKKIQEMKDIVAVQQALLDEINEVSEYDEE